MQLPLPLAELQLPVIESILPPRPRRVFCNRSLRLDRVAWVGFDMDYTLAIYRQSEMDRLSIEATARKLVGRGHPEALLTMPYRTDFPVRGLLIDRKLGNVLKMDRYRYVKKAYHGMRELTRDERRQHYHSRRVRPGSKRYHWVDTLYALSEVAVFCAAIEVLEKRHEEIDYDALFTDVRECIDESHRDGSILDEIVSDLPRFVHGDPTLGPTLHKLRSAGKKLFLLTNSHPAYTDRMMSFLLEHGLGDYPSWRHYFDIIVTAACKPVFFTGRERFVDVSNGAARTATTLERGRVYMGGNFLELEQNLQVDGGDQVLYVGDHIYGDVLRAKKDSAWRTMMIIQEMDAELETLSACAETIDRFDSLHEMRNTLYHELRGLQHRLRAIQRTIEHAIEAGAPVPTELDVARVTHKRAMDRLRARIRATEDELHQIEDTIDAAFHPFWGPLFMAGPEVSSFGDQVEEFACLYTDRVSNLLSYSPMHYFRSPRDRMPHER